MAYLVSYPLGRNFLTSHLPWNETVFFFFYHMILAMEFCLTIHGSRINVVKRPRTEILKSIRANKMLLFQRCFIRYSGIGEKKVRNTVITPGCQSYPVTPCLQSPKGYGHRRLSEQVILDASMSTCICTPRNYIRPSMVVFLFNPSAPRAR